MNQLNVPAAAWVIFVLAAVLEVGGDAVIRKGLMGRSLGLIALGGLMLAAYGLAVNTLKWDFSRLLGVYVAVFALVSVLFGRFVFGEAVSPGTWIGVAVIVLGGGIVQFFG